MASALGIAATPGDDDNWQLAVALVIAGTAIFFIFRPRWLTEPKNVRWQFSLRTLFIAQAVFGICLAFNVWVVFHRQELLKYRQAGNSILQNYVATIGLQEDSSMIGALPTKIVWLSVNDFAVYETLGEGRAGFMEANRLGCRWVSGGSENYHRPFGNSDLAGIVGQYQDLRYLDLRKSIVTETGLLHLQNLESLERLWLDPSQCTAKGLALLHKLASLKQLSIDTSKMTDDELTSLKQALPDCKISPKKP